MTEGGWCRCPGQRFFGESRASPFLHRLPDAPVFRKVYIFPVCWKAHKQIPDNAAGNEKADPPGDCSIIRPLLLEGNNWLELLGEVGDCWETAGPVRSQSFHLIQRVCLWRGWCGGDGRDGRRSGGLRFLETELNADLRPDDFMLRRFRKVTKVTKVTMWQQLDAVIVA